MTVEFPEKNTEAQDEATREHPRLAEELHEMLQADKAWESYKGYGEEYRRENYERAKEGKIAIYAYPEATLIASVRVDEAGQPISGHEQNPEAKSHEDLEEAFQEYLASTPPDQRLVIFEGSPEDFPDRTTAIQRRADSGLAQFLAKTTDVPMVTGEPSDEEVAAELEGLGVPRVETALFTMLRALGPQLLANQGNVDLSASTYFQCARNGVVGFREYSDAEKAAISRDPQKRDALLAALSHQATELAMREFNPILEAQGLPVFFVSDGRLQYSIDDPTRLINIASPTGKGRMNQIGRSVSEYRDRHIFDVITGAVTDGKKPFVPYGGSHLVALRPALDVYFGQPAEIRQPD